MGAPGNVGLAHRAAIAAGAGTDLMDQAWWSPGLVHPDGRAAFALCFTGGIFVDRAGRRFVNESAAYDRSGREIIRAMSEGTVGPRYWMIYDSRNGEQPPVMAPNVSFSPTSDYVSAGLWRAGRLVGRARAPDRRSRQTISLTRCVASTISRRETTTRTSAAAGSPSTARSPAVRRRWCRSTPRPIAPRRSGLSDLGTKGGLRTDVDARVLDVDGRPIPGLYAAGNTMAAVSGTTYPGGGNPIGASLLFSHRAALHMAAER